MAAACLPLGARARVAPVVQPRPAWLWGPAPGDDSDCEGAESVDEPPMRQLFDPQACAAAEERPAPRRTAHDGAAAAEIGALLRGLAASASQGASAQQRMLAVCRIVLAHLATWFKPAVAPNSAALQRPGAVRCA